MRTAKRTNRGWRGFSIRVSGQGVKHMDTPVPFPQSEEKAATGHRLRRAVLNYLLSGLMRRWRCSACSRHLSASHEFLTTTTTTIIRTTPIPSGP